MGEHEVRRFVDPSGYRETCAPFLMAREAVNGLPLGLLGGIESGAWRDPLLACVVRGEAVALAALRTPPYDLVLSHADGPDAVRALAKALAGAPGPQAVPGVLGPRAVADVFAAAWVEATTSHARLGRRERIFRLDRLATAPGAPGVARPAARADRARVRAWMAAFLDEALPDERGDPDAATDRWLSRTDGGLWLWEVAGAPVAMAGAAGPTPNGIRIAAVYTPPEQRRRGYAGALVAEVSARQLAAGRRFCFLFTDLANPTSNRLYRRLGYRPVEDVHHYGFAAR